MRFFITLLVLICLCVYVHAGVYSESQFKSLFTSFTKKYKRAYTGSNLLTRLDIFKKNIEKITLRNAATKSFVLKPNAFADMTDDEIKAMQNKEDTKGRTMVKSTIYDIYNEKLPKDVPESFSWVEKGGVLPVLNQGRCGSCWSFAAAATIEGRQFKETGKLIKYSEQYFLDCAYNGGSLGGCSGANCFALYTYIANNGACTHEAYGKEYTGEKGDCRQCEHTAKPNYVNWNANGNEDVMKREIFANGPLYGRVFAYNSDFMYYSSGILDTEVCLNAKHTDHAIAIVGYGTEDGKDYWLIKNSWGTDWGENGYMRLARGKNMCQVNSFPGTLHYNGVF